MAAYPLTDAYYLQQQQQPPSAAPATVAQAKPSTTAPAPAAAATSIYERQLQHQQQHPLPPSLQQPMLLQSSLVLTTAAADHPSYGQQHQHSQQQHQHPPGGAGGGGGGAGGRGCCPTSLRPAAQVNILSSVGNVPLAPSSHLLLSHPNLSLHRPPPPHSQQPERRKQLPPEAAASSADPSSGGGDAQVSRMPSIVARHHWSSSKTDCLLPKSLDTSEMSASAGSSSAAAAAFNRRQRKVAPPASSQPNIPCQPPSAIANSMTGVGGGSCDDINSYLAKTMHRQYQGTTAAVDSPISLFNPGAKSTAAVSVANGWSSSSCAADRNLSIDDQPLDLTSVKKKRHAEESASDDCPLDLSVKRRRVDDGFSADRQQRHQPVIDGHLGFPYNRPDTVAASGGPLVSHEINARLSLQRSLVDQFGQPRVFSLPPGAVLIPPSVVSGVSTSPRGHRQTQNHQPRTKAGNASPRSSSFAANPFPMLSSSYSLNEVPVIRTAMASFQLLSQSSGLQSGLTSASVTSGKSGSASIGRNSALCGDLGNHFAMGQRPRSLLQPQHQQPSLGACSTTPRDNIPKMLMSDQKMSLTDFNELSKYSDLNRASAAAAAPTALEVGSHLQAAPVIKSFQQHQQQQQQQQQKGSFSKQTTVGVISCSDVNNKHKLNNSLHDALASSASATASIPKTSYGARPNSRGSHTKQPRTPRPSVNPQATVHDASSSSFFTPTSSSSNASVTDQRTSNLEYIRIHDQDQLLKTPKRETYLVGSAAPPSATKVELTWTKQTESMPAAKSEMSFQREEETKPGIMQTMQNESPRKTLPSGDTESLPVGLNRSYFQQGFSVTENNRLTGISSEILKDDSVVKTEVSMDDLKQGASLANLSMTQNWMDSAGTSKWSDSNIGARCAETDKPPIDPMGQSYAVHSDRLESIGGPRSTFQPNERGEVIKISEALTNYSDGSVQKTCVPPKEHDVSFVNKSHQCPTLPIVSADPPPPQESKDEAVDKDASPRRGVGAAGGCEACKWKDSSSDQSPPPTNSSIPKIISPCRSYDPPRELLCDGSHPQAPTASAAFSGDLIARQCTCRGFDRPGPRRIPVANVQPFMKEPADAAVFKSSADPAQSSVEDVQKREDPQTNASSAAKDDANAKATMATGAVKIDNQVVGLTYGDTPHLKEFVKFLEISAANPYRTPDEKLCETLDGGRGGPNESTDCDDRGRVKRQLLLHLAGPKGRPSGEAVAKREGSMVVGFDSKRTPIEYIDEENCVEPIKRKEKATSETRGVDPPERTSSTAENNDDSLYGASALYQTMKALDRQAEDRIKASLLLANSGAAATFSLSKTDGERKAPLLASSSAGDEGASCGLNRASGRPLTTTTDVTLEQRKKKKQKQKVTSMNEATDEHLETQRIDDTKSNIAWQRMRDAQAELASSVVASATDETAASEAVTDSYVASTSALDEFTSSSKPVMKRKYQRKKTKQEELPGTAEGNHLAADPIGGKSSTTSMSSSESTEVTPKKKRRRAIELLTQFNPPEEARDVDEDRISRSVTELNSSVTHSSSSILLQIPQFLQQTPVESSTGRRRGTSTRRDGSIVRHARRSSNYDRNAAHEADLKQEAERRLVRRGGHGRGCRAAARHQQRMLGPHRRNDAEPRSDTPSASSYAADDVTDQYHHHQPQSQKVDDETTRDLFEYDDSSDAVFPSRRGVGGGQGRKPVRKNGRIAFQYPEVFGRRRARGGLRGRSRPVRSSGGPGSTRAWDIHGPSDLKDFELDGPHNEGVTIDDDQRDSFSARSIGDQAPPAAESATSIRGKVRSRVRVGGRGSRGHPRTHSAPRYDPLQPSASTDSRPSGPSALGRDTSETRLHQVTRLGYEELVSYYLTTGIIHPNVQDNSGVTPLHDSCSHGYLNITRLLLDHGAHPNSKTLDGTRPLHLAVANDHVEIVRLLLSYGADVTMTNVIGRNPHQMAKTRDMKQLLKGFASDLSGGKGKEIPWQFPALFEIGVCDILADAPSDDLKEAGEVTFDLVADNSLPIHRFVSDSQKGPRNFHSVSDLCEDVKVEDFLLLNGDLTYVHVASPAEFLSSMETSSSDIPGHPLPGPSSSSSAATASLDHHPSTLSIGASTSSSISSISQLQLQQQPHRGWMSLSTSRQRTMHCSSATGVDRSSYVEIDVSLKGLLDIGVHRVPLHTRSDVVPWPSSARFSCPRRKKAGDSRDPPATSGTTPNRLSSGTSLSGSDLCSASPSSTSCPPIAPHTSKSELANPGDVTAAAPSGADMQPRNCETATGSGSSEQSPTKHKLPNCQSSAGPPLCSVPTARATPLPPADPKGESGNTRETLEQCRIVLCDIKNPSSLSSSTDLNSIKCDARKDADKQPATVNHKGEEEKDDRKKTERKQVVHCNDHSALANSLPVKSTSVVEKTTGCVAKTSKDLTVSLHSMSIAVSQQRSSLGSLERGVTNGPSSSAIAVATVPHQRLSVFSNARRRAVPRELVDGVMTSKPEAAPSESLIPVLEKHGSDDETPPVENEEDVCGESYDDEREMPQLTLYA